MDGPLQIYLFRVDCSLVSTVVSRLHQRSTKDDQRTRYQSDEVLWLQREWLDIDRTTLG